MPCLLFLTLPLLRATRIACLVSSSCPSPLQRGKGCMPCLFSWPLSSSVQQGMRAMPTNPALRCTLCLLVLLPPTLPTAVDTQKQRMHPPLPPPLRRATRGTWTQGQDTPQAPPPPPEDPGPEGLPPVAPTLAGPDPGVGSPGPKQAGVPPAGSAVPGAGPQPVKLPPGPATRTPVFMG